MIFEITQEQKENLVKKQDLKIVHADSTICHYCARYISRDEEFDAGVCEECIGASNFMGIECITYKEEL